MRPYSYLGGRRALTELATGQPFIVNTDARDIATWIIRTGEWETYVDAILSALAAPGGVVLDIGANMGYYTIKLGGLVGPTGRVFSFEPNPLLFQVLSDNIKINGMGERVQAFNVAAGETSGASTLVFDPYWPGGGQVGAAAAAARPSHDLVEIQVEPIDLKLPPDCVADLVKIDVEGFEPLVFAGMKALLARSPNAAIVTEIAYADWARFGDPAALLRAIAGNRRIFCIHEDRLLEELTDDIDHALNRDFVSYMLLLPRTEEAWLKIAPFTRSREVISPPEVVPPPPQDADPPAAPPLGPAARIAAALLRHIVKQG